MALVRIVHELVEDVRPFQRLHHIERLLYGHGKIVVRMDHQDRLRRVRDLMNRGREPTGFFPASHVSPIGNPGLERIQFRPLRWRQGKRRRRAKGAHLAIHRVGDRRARFPRIAPVQRIEIVGSRCTDDGADVVGGLFPPSGPGVGPITKCGG